MPENVSPTIQGRDFVVATVAAPTVVKEPEKPVEAEAEAGEGASEATTEDGDASKETAGDKPADGEKSKEDDKKTTPDKK